MKAKLFKSNSLSLGLVPTELHGVSKTSKSITMKSSITGTSSVEIDANMWLPMAAKQYHISPYLSDYIMVPVPSIISELPNTNGDSVSKQELLKFNPQQGRMAYRTFKGKPTHEEHNNKDITLAKGVILDVYLKPLPQFRGQHLKLVKLLAFDRTKDAELCRQILDNEINTYSMGMLYSAYQCSHCGHIATSDSTACTHTNVKQKLYAKDKHLVYRKCMNISGFETSLVRDPAYSLAIGGTILNPMSV